MQKEREINFDFTTSKKEQDKKKNEKIANRFCILVMALGISSFGLIINHATMHSYTQDIITSPQNPEKAAMVSQEENKNYKIIMAQQEKIVDYLKEDRQLNLGGKKVIPEIVALSKLSTPVSYYSVLQEYNNNRMEGQTYEKALVALESSPNKSAYLELLTMRTPLDEEGRVIFDEKRYSSVIDQMLLESFKEHNYRTVIKFLDSWFVPLEFKQKYTLVMQKKLYNEVGEMYKKWQENISKGYKVTQVLVWNKSELFEQEVMSQYGQYWVWVSQTIDKKKYNLSEERQKFLDKETSIFNSLFIKITR